MKTILYDPVFINPQAYYVFPQLYDIQPKENDYIEQAIFAGKLIVKDVNNETNQQIFENTKQIDLSNFRDKLIQIDQYTDIGNTVLGKWFIPEDESSNVLLDEQDITNSPEWNTPEQEII